MTESIKTTIETFTAEERRLLLYKLQSLTDKGGGSSQRKSSKRLVAYIRPHDSYQPENLQAYMKEQLPAHMIPSTVQLVEDFPYLPNGKIDKGALRKTKLKVTKKTKEARKSTSEVEKKLIAIWEDVLAFSPILTTDNFFEIGGDSILSIQIVAKARKLGIQLSPNQLFENQTIAELALFAKSENDQIKIATVEGDIPLTPIQHWFFDLHKSAPHYWNQIMEVRNTGITQPSILKEIVGEIIGHHDALRLSFKKLGDDWRARVLNQQDIHFFYHIDIKQFTDQKEQDKEVRNQLIAHQTAFDMSNGGLFRCVFFEGGKAGENRIFLIGHHLVTDMVSWNILQNDFRQLLRQQQQREHLELENKIATIKDWSEQLSELRSSADINKEVSYWQSQVCAQDLFPPDTESQQSIFEESSIHVLKWVLNENDTSFLMQEANELYNTKTEDLLITALVATICSWEEIKEFCFLMERHGRTAELLSADVSNTVGWFTSFFPVRIDLNSDGDIGEQIKGVKERIRNIPNNGIGYGVLKYLSDGQQLQGNPPLVFNYLGNKKSTNLPGEIIFTPRPEDIRHPSSERNYSIEINAFISEGQLHLNWSFAADKYKPDTMENLTAEFEANIKNIIEYCKNKDSGEYTPSDFPEANISQEDLDNLLKGM
ncbi:condensation domain-containing protein [Muriicola sp. Z0-33]|uniref:condensation domain-containing protein n=1 Tax=Muriicola sp. Z0-33 TaxID=2816957 RepID=UPI002238839E|nr:condensation domain-containing protein [Muriicola sp. Z0-33]MCW5515229.1 hypothetical protein [Muriicola sp. Z0-33]